MADSLFDLGKKGAEKIEANSSAKNKERLMEMYEREYRGRFEENMERDVPRHPWHIFKDIRAEVRETYPSSSDERHERVFVLQQIFDEFKERWEVYRSNFKKDGDEN